MQVRWSWLALGLGAYLAFTLAMFPAAAALHWFLPPGVTVAGVSGSIWSGRVASLGVGGVQTANVRWTTRPWLLVLGRIGATVEAQLPDGFIAADIVASSARVELTGLRCATSLAALSGALPLRGIQGQLSASLSSLVLENGWPVNAIGELQVRALEVLPFIPTPNQGPVPVGDYTLTFVPADTSGLNAKVTDAQGPLEVVGTVSLDPARRYALDLQIKPRPQASQVLVEGLKIMTSEPDATGHQRLMLTGSL